MGVDAADAFFEGDVFGFGDEELSVVAGVEEDFHGAVGRYWASQIHSYFKNQTR